ncbi:hypothetical protein IQ249_22310 [Lusitaniella coriacea LEGE 07157]|uniref:Uncharacterized protein n=1 Tax=Lusitaniella coriacea LEGE 07157 TaxID=945747 RepID=A0A8J7DZN0_9CYAN|nr:hypothetical protein [Lusitaniella coriacea]MBE9118627.1 hypothetical protein [Lusitaniella coriacea LEGE 07157]
MKRAINSLQRGQAFKLDSSYYIFDSITSWGDREIATTYRLKSWGIDFDDGQLLNPDTLVDLLKLPVSVTPLMPMPQ